MDFINNLVKKGECSAKCIYFKYDISNLNHLLQVCQALLRYQSVTIATLLWSMEDDALTQTLYMSLYTNVRVGSHTIKIYSQYHLFWLDLNNKKAREDNESFKPSVTCSNPAEALIKKQLLKMFVRWKIEKWGEHNSEIQWCPLMMRIFHWN